MTRRPTNRIKHTTEVDLNDGEVDLKKLHDEFDEKIILTTLEYYGGVQLDTAAALGRSRRWVWKRIKDLGLEKKVKEITTHYAKWRQ